MDEPGFWQGMGSSVTGSFGRDGSISQYTNIFNAHYGNGLTGRRTGSGPWIDRTNRHLAGLEKSPGARWQTVEVSGVPYWNLVGPVGDITASLFNCYSIAMEHEGFTGDVWTEAMIEADIMFKKWAIEEVERYGPSMGIPPMVVDGDLLVGHNQIDSVNRSGCPGINYPRDRILAALLPAPTPEQTDEEKEANMRFVNGRAAFFEAATFKEGLSRDAHTKFWVTRDYGITNASPKPVVARLEVELASQQGRGWIEFYHGHDPKLYAYRIDTSRGEFHGSFEVTLDANGDCEFSVGAGTTVNWVGILGYR